MSATALSLRLIPILPYAGFEKTLYLWVLAQPKVWHADQ